MVAQTVKDLPAMQKIWVRSLGWEDALEEGMATRSSILAWRIPMDREARRTAVRGFTKSQTRLMTEQLSRAQQNFQFLEEPPAKEEGTTFLRLTTAPNTVISICLLFFLPRVLFLFYWKSLIKKNFIYLLFWPSCVACGILVPQSGIEPVPPAMEERSPYHWTIRKVPLQLLYQVSLVAQMVKDLPAMQKIWI